MGYETKSIAFIANEGVEDVDITYK